MKLNGRRVGQRKEEYLRAFAPQGCLKRVPGLALQPDECGCDACWLLLINATLADIGEHMYLSARPTIFPKYFGAEPKR